MNTLVHIVGLVAVGWLTAEIFSTWGVPVLGFIGIGIFAWLIPMTWVAIQEDKEIFGGKWWPF